MAKAFLKYLFSLSVILILGSGQIKAQEVHIGSHPGTEESTEEAIQNANEMSQDQYAVIKNIGKLTLASILEVPFFEEEEEKLNSSSKTPLGALIFIILTDSQLAELESSTSAIDAYHPGIISDRYLLFEVFRI